MWYFNVNAILFWLFYIIFHLWCPYDQVASLGEKLAASFNKLELRCSSAIE